MDSKDIVVILPEELREKFLKMKPLKEMKRGRPFEKWEDEFIIYAWDKYRKEDIAKLLNRCTKVVRQRYEYLKSIS